VSGIGRGQFTAILDIETDWAKIVTIHATVYGKAQRVAFGFEFRSKGSKCSIWLAVATTPVGAQMNPSWVKAANDIGNAIERLVAAGLGRRHACRSQTEEGKGSGAQEK
jgi:hypothetical protein